MSGRVLRAAGDAGVEWPLVINTCQPVLSQPVPLVSLSFSRGLDEDTEVMLMIQLWRCLLSTHLVQQEEMSWPFRLVKVVVNNENRSNMLLILQTQLSGITRFSDGIRLSLFLIKHDAFNQNSAKD